MSEESAVNAVTGRLEILQTWFVEHVLVVDTLLEIGLVLAVAIVAWVLAKPVEAAIGRMSARQGHHPNIKRLLDILHSVTFHGIWLLGQGMIIVAAIGMEWRYGVLRIVASLLTAWIVIRLAVSVVRNPAVARTVSLTVWFIAALQVLGLLSQTADVLDSLAINVGTVRMSALLVIQGTIALTILLWVFSLLTSLFESRISSSTTMTPSVQVLVSKLLRTAGIVMAVLIALGVIGVDITALSVLGGAIGVGIGFGLQKIFANFISGIILLMDKSIKPGDVIAVAGYYGRVDALGARYVSVLTRDGVEHLIPNEELIINRVENWSHTHNLLRLKLEIGVHYRSDVHLAKKLILEAADEVERVLKEPAAMVPMRAFADSAVMLELRFWINDPMNGRANVCSEILFKVWDKFHANGIEIPYPQRDLHIRTPVVESLADVKAAFAAGDG